MEWSPEPTSAPAGGLGTGLGPGAGEHRTDTPMLERGSRIRPKTSIALFGLAAFTFLFVLSAARPVSGELPYVIVNPDASRTVVWNLTSRAGLSLQNTTLVGGKAVLPWENATVDWPRASDFLSHGSADANLTTDGTNLTLRADLSNHVTNGDFASNAIWTYANGTSRNVTASWDPAALNALMAHDSPAVSNTSWDTMDAINLTWQLRAPPGVPGFISQEYVHQREGKGALNLSFSIGSGTGLYAGAHPLAVVNWSGDNRLLAWVMARNVTSPLWLNVTANVSGSSRTTVAQSLSLGWQEVVINLDQIGAPSERSNLQDVVLRINGRNVASTFVYFDDLRLANAKAFNETATVAQAIIKASSTSPSPGSAILALDWDLIDATGVRSVTARVNVTGSSTSIEHSLSQGPLGSWRKSSFDLSPSMSSSGTYAIRFQFQVAVDNVTASSSHFRIDNVSLWFPNRHNGSYASNPIPLYASSEFRDVNWSGSLPAGTSARLSLRSGNDSNPNGSGWSALESWTSFGVHPVSLPGARYFQVRMDLATVNASLSPSVAAFGLDTMHRAAIGNVTSDPFRAMSDFLRWRSFNVSSSVGASTSIAFDIGNGSYWTAVPADGNVSGFAGPDIRWRAQLVSSDGLVTPSLGQVRLTYEYLGGVQRVLVSPTGPVRLESGQKLSFRARAVDAGNHTLSVPSFGWSTNNTRGSVDNDGTFTAGDPGNWVVTATVPGTFIFGTVQVTVTPSSFLPSPFDLLPYVLLALACGGAGYGSYEIAIRRMFAIDDVFLISKEGRLLMHNTRRMRADRDEDILSAMFTAILTFLRDFDREETGDLRRFEFGRKTALLERGDHAYVAAVYSGRVPRWAGKDLRRFMYDLERRFGETFARWSGDPDDLQGLKEFSDRFVARFRYRSFPRGKRGAP